MKCTFKILIIPLLLALVAACAPQQNKGSLLTTSESHVGANSINSCEATAQSNHIEPTQQIICNGGLCCDRSTGDYWQIYAQQDDGVYPCTPSAYNYCGPMHY